MKTVLETLKEMIDIAIAFNPGDKKVVLTNDGEHITVTRIVKKLHTADLKKEDIVDTITEKAKQYPDFDISYVEVTKK